uniref:Uncharacterized protein n=1 Tax=Megaselia scalaris TaxID=36166 RepID=T1GJX3_MEGSC
MKPEIFSNFILGCDNDIKLIDMTTTGVEGFENEAKSRGFDVNGEKTKYMLSSRNDANHNPLVPMSSWVVKTSK